MTSYKKIIKTLVNTSSILLVALILNACEAKTSIRGNLPRDYKLKKLEIGKFDRNQVARMIGSPSAVGIFDSSTWYYISHRTEQWAFFEPEITDQQIVIIDFDSHGLLKDIKYYNKEDIRKIVMQERETPTTGHSLGIFEQLLGNFGKFN